LWPVSKDQTVTSKLIILHYYVATAGKIFYVINKNRLAELMRVGENLRPDVNKKIILKQTYDKLR
jgi:hypothetical protein